MSATGQPDNGCQIGFKPMVPGFTYVAYNNLEAFKAACNENTIAIMFEPVQGEGGVHPATMEFMKGIRKFCDEKGILLLLDEVQTGWCRTGKPMAYMHYDIKPDIVSMAKAMGGGMPIAAICASSEVAKAFTPGSHGTTYGGNPVCCAASYAQIKELLSRDLAGNVKHGCFDRKLLITAIGKNTIRMVPPLIATKADCDKAFNIIKATVEALTESKEDEEITA